MLDGRFRFDNFVVGVANRLAASAARAVSEAPGAAYNPLFIYSSSGLGKTHLLGAIGHLALQQRPDLTVEFLTLDDFVDQLHQAIATGQAELFKRRYLGVDLLLLDDVQFLTGRVETQSEMLRILNALQGGRRQIVMTCDRPPSEIADVDDRLLSRLAGGLIVDVGAPDYETRVAILQHKCAERDVRLAAGVLEELARTPTGNVRELHGALNRLIAHQALLETPLGVSDVRHIIGVAEPEAPAADEFECFLSDVAVTVAESVEAWRVKLAERIARWSGEGFRTAMLERELERRDPPDLHALEATFAAAAERLRVLEAEAVTLDPAHAGLPIFRDPERAAEAEAFLVRAVALCDPPPGPRAGFRLHNLVRTAVNEVALQAAGVIVAEPGSRYNPLFVHGPAGSGKSHLAHAIGNAVRARANPAPVVACVNAASFVEELIAALESGTVDRWRARYRAVDMLIVDDVHELEGKERSQDEFFHLFNVLQQDGRQVVLTSARALGTLGGLQARLRSRFEGGLVAALDRAPGIDRFGRSTPVPDGAEAAAPTIDVILDETLATTEADAACEQATRAPPPLDSFFLDEEKVIADWAGIEGRVLEDLR
ncbi:MAG: DnaA/Hda family protein [Gemmatimonadaceae bacterium]